MCLLVRDGTGGRQRLTARDEILEDVEMAVGSGGMPWRGQLGVKRKGRIYMGVYVKGSGMLGESAVEKMRKRRGWLECDLHCCSTRCCGSEVSEW